MEELESLANQTDQKVPAWELVKSVAAWGGGLAAGATIDILLREYMPAVEGVYKNLVVKLGVPALCGLTSFAVGNYIRKDLGDLDETVETIYEMQRSIANERTGTQIELEQGEEDGQSCEE